MHTHSVTYKPYDCHSLCLGLPSAKTLKGSGFRIQRKSEPLSVGYAANAYHRAKICPVPTASPEAGAIGS